MQVGLRQWTHLASFPFSSRFSCEGAPGLREASESSLLILVLLLVSRLLLEDGVAGKGFTVAADRALSVEELATEPIREAASFLAIITTRHGQICARPYHCQKVGEEEASAYFMLAMPVATED